MSDKPFVHLHCHSDYSLLDGACEIGKMMREAEVQGMSAIALTDHGNLFGAMEFYTKANDKGVRPILGCEVYISQQERHIKNETNRYNHLVLLCENQEGYRNLIDLVSTGYLEGFYYKPRFDKDYLAQHSKGLIALSACLKGEVTELMLRDRYDDARRTAYEFQDIFGKDNFFLEIQDHNLPEDRIAMPGIYRLSSETGIPLVATNDAHYIGKDDARSQDIMTCIQTGKTVNDEKRMRMSTQELFLKTRPQMMQLFGEVEDALDRTWDIAQRCNVKIEKIKDPFPKFDVPAEHTLDSYFAWVARQGFERRRVRIEQKLAEGRLKHRIEEYIERLETEIALIEKLKFAGYFLIVWDFIRYAKSTGVPVGPGRGSAAGSLVAYCMGITDVDPLQFNLLFERFLNPERVSFPDIDVDFCTNRRGEVIQYVTQKYGREQVSQIITFGTLGAKQALKDVSRALELSFSEADRLTKLVPNQLNITLQEALDQEPAFQDAASKDPRVRDVIDTSLRLEGMARNCGTHAAGVVISPRPLKELVPLYKTNKDEIVTQYDMKYLEKLGLLKMDFLGLTTLTIVNEALVLIKKTRGIDLVLDDVPTDDKDTYQRIFSQGLTSGVFQFESSGMKDVLRRYQPERIEDLVALNALYRPGPIKGGVVDDFIDRKHGRKKVVYDVAETQPLLEETYGIILYQEQVMQIAQVVAGYRLSEADLLRRAMGKKKVEEMGKQRTRFMQGACERGINEKKAEKLFDLMAQFAEYGFNKSHSAAYGYLAYLTGYLKAHYAVEFMAALLTSETGTTDKVVKYINECRDLGISILQPDVNASDLNFTPDNGAIRFGLGAVKNVGSNAVQTIVEARQTGGPYKSLDDFCERVDLNAVNRRVIESLIKAGAMDKFPGTRAQKMAIIDEAMETGQRARKDRESGQAGLFGELMGIDDSSAPARAFPRVPEWDSRESLRGEKETIGYYVTGHPLDEYRWKIKELSTHNSESVGTVERGREVTICGVLTGIAKKRNKEQKPWAIAQLEDLAGSTEVLIFATRYETLQKEIEEDRPVLVYGKAMPEEDGSTKINVQEIVPLEQARVSLPSLISIRVRIDKDKDRANQLKQLFERKQGETGVRLKLEKSKDFTLHLDVPTRVLPDKEFKAEIEKICGPESFEVLAS